MNNRDFAQWLSKFRISISGYNYYSDFNKVITNTEKVKKEIETLNSLINSPDIEADFERLVTENPTVLKCIPVLLAVRQQQIYARDEDGEFLYDFENMNYPVEQYKTFMRKTGLFDLITHISGNLYDYVLGVETGLDSNGRKNRGGHQMEDLVENYIKKSGVKEYYKEMYLSQIEEMWGLDLSALSNNGKARKRFDFVVKTDTMVYAVETNFYGGSGGSKLNETARSYKMLATEAAGIEGFSFVWFTDGVAWNSAKGNLFETFQVMEHIYSIDDMENGIMKKIFC